MSTQKNGATNGTATPNKTNAKEVATVVNLTLKKEEQPKPEPKPELTPAGKAGDLPPVEDRVLKVQQLFDLINKREKLKESLKKLNSIKASSDNRDLKITIEDDNEEWETHNTDAIRDCIATMKATIQTKLKEAEDSIRF